MKGSLPHMPKIWSQGSCWGRAGLVVARRARSPSHLSLRNAVWGAGCRTLEAAFPLDSILWKDCPFMAQRGGRFLEGASPQKAKCGLVFRRAHPQVPAEAEMGAGALQICRGSGSERVLRGWQGR